MKRITIYLVATSSGDQLAHPVTLDTASASIGGMLLDNLSLTHTAIRVYGR